MVFLNMTLETEVKLGTCKKPFFLGLLSAKAAGFSLVDNFIVYRMNGVSVAI